MPRGYPNPKGPISEQTQRLMQALHELEERVAVEKAKDRARASLLLFAHKHDLTAADLREAARAMSKREKGDAPAISQNFTAAKGKQLGKQIAQARKAKGLSGLKLGKMVGAKGTGAVAAWERGSVPANPNYRAGLIKHLDLPKDFFKDARPPSVLHGAAPKARANGSAAHA